MKNLENFRQGEIDARALAAICWKRLRSGSMTSKDVVPLICNFLAVLDDRDLEIMICFAQGKLAYRREL